MSPAPSPASPAPSRWVPLPWVKPCPFKEEPRPSLPSHTLILVGAPTVGEAISPLREAMPL